jgi:uncharacterized protein YbjT (DUF2867 family)
MRVLLIGATGFLGSAIRVALAGAGHSVVATYHRGSAPANDRFTQWRRCDLVTMSVETWSEMLRDVEAVINCSGVLQDNFWESTSAVHASGLRPLLEACERARLFRFIHFSAIGADRHEATAFSRSKREGETLVTRSLLDWVILRPSVVVGTAAFGGSALFRGLAALPLLPVMPGTGPLQIVQRVDVVATALHFLTPVSRPRQALDLAGPEVLSMSEVVGAYRNWLCWQPARLLYLPHWLAGLFYRAGDLARSLGWRPPLGSTARLEMQHGAIGDPAPWIAETGLQPASLDEAFARTPASVQERWFAALYLLKPIGFTVFALFWIATGIISLTGGFDSAIALMRKAGGGEFTGPLVIGGALADIVIGAAIALRRTARLGLLAALALTLFYVAAASIMVPHLWAEPLGPLTKIFPLLVFNVMLLAILEER